MPPALPHPIRLPPPAAHRAGCLEILRFFDKKESMPLLRLLDAQPLPASLAPEDQALKYDVYRALSPDQPAWGLTWNARWSMAEQDINQLENIYCNSKTPYPWEAARTLNRRIVDAALPGPAPMQTLAAAFTGAGLPRLKLYLQEDRWGAGVCRAAALAPAAAQLGLTLPAWLPPEAVIGVVAMDLLPDGGSGLRFYLGRETVQGLSSSIPAGFGLLAAPLAAASPLGGGWHYLTVRLRDGEPRLALNKIYNPVQDAFTTRDRFHACWRDALSLLRTAGREADVRDLLGFLQASPHLRAIPTATAISTSPGSDGLEVDLYLTAWDLSG
jgi:hypothetical protein